MNAILYNRIHRQHLPSYERHNRNVFQKTSDAATGIWNFLAVTFITASWITAYLMSKTYPELRIRSVHSLK
jgi:hypothetical protein